MSMKTAQDSTDFCALLLGIIGQISQMPLRFKARAYVRIGEAPDEMFARHHGFEQLNVVPGKRIECPHSTARRRLSLLL